MSDHFRKRIAAMMCRSVLAVFISLGMLSFEGVATAISHVVAENVTKPLPIFSHATVYQGLVHVSCIQGFLPGTFDFPGPDAASQASQALENLKTVLEQSNSGLARVLKMTLYFVDMDADFAAVNEIINRYFPNNPPARSSIGVANLPRKARFVIEVVAAENEPPSTRGSVDARHHIGAQI